MKTRLRFYPASKTYQVTETVLGKPILIGHYPTERRARVEVKRREAISGVSIIYEVIKNTPGKTYRVMGIALSKQTLIGSYPTQYKALTEARRCAGKTCVYFSHGYGRYRVLGYRGERAICRVTSDE